MKSRQKDFVVSAKYVTDKDIILLLTNRGNIKRLRPEEILKGKRSHVGKMYLKIVRSNLHEAIDMNVIRHKNANSQINNYIITDKGFVLIDYTVLRIAIADNGRKMVPTDMGTPIKLSIYHNDNDLEL